MTRRIPGERSALDSYRSWGAPSANARERMLRGLTRRVALGELPDLIVPDPPTRLAQPSPGPVRHLRKWAGTGLGGTLIGLSAWLWLASGEPKTPSPLLPTAAAPEPPQPLAAALADPPAAPPVLRVTPEPAAPVERHTSRAAVPRTRAPGAKPAAPRVTAPTPAPAAPAAAAPKRRELDEELELMRAAYEALRAGRPDRALEHLAEHAARFPDGELAESREVTHMIALCQTGEVAAARTSAARFLAHAPDSPYAARVRLICSKPSGR